MGDSSTPLPTTERSLNNSFPPLTTETNRNNSFMDLTKSLFSPKLIRMSTSNTRRSLALAYAFTFILVACTFLFVFNSSNVNHSSALFKIILRNRSQFHTFFSHRFFNNGGNVFVNVSSISYNEAKAPESYQVNLNGEINGGLNRAFETLDNKTEVLLIGGENKEGGNSTAELMKEKEKEKKKKKSWLETMSQCDVFDGNWIKDDLNPLYEPGSCPHIDEPFDCHRNGRTDKGYEKFRWKPNHCDIPRLNGKNMLKLLRGKRLVYVGDSLNRNMWESMVCLLRNSVSNKSRVFEASGKSEFKTEGAYSFIFQEYNCSVEFIRSPFLVQEWEMPENNGSKKETLRLDLVENSSPKYKDADILVFNTGHWWTHEKTSEGKGYYQEGSHVYEKLDVVEAFRKAMTTWAKWIEANTNAMKTHIFFRGYSVSHFSGGEWYSGGKCDGESQPIQDEKDLSPNLYPPITGMLEQVLKEMRTPVFYLNITRMTDFRRDAHPSIYRKPIKTEEDKFSLLRHQDCSHWCLPGVPDTWNELLYAQILLKHKRRMKAARATEMGQWK